MNQQIARRAFTAVNSQSVTQTPAQRLKPSLRITGLSRKLYLQYFKRLLDIVLSAFALVALSPLLCFVALMVRVKLGSPVLFRQTRSGQKDASGQERLFTLYKFRSMTDERDSNGKLLPDEVRLPWFGKMLRKMSLDELPELWNILKGDMSVIGPRPLLIRDMVFMTGEQRNRHNVQPGLSGLAQINGRNCLQWEDKLDYDQQYVRQITFWGDIKIILITILKVLRTESITFEGMATSEDLGDYLLRSGKVDYDLYLKGQQKALSILEGERKCSKS